jgi:tetratricopeptide (TPR) repeat protein
MTNRKWKIYKKFRNYKENEISLNLIIMSKTTFEFVNRSGNENFSRQLYNEGCRLYIEKDYTRALYFFNESIMFSEYSLSLSKFNLCSTNDEFINDNYNDAIMNRAATYYQLNQIDNACKDWEKILNNKPKILKNINDARENIRQICK